MNTTTAHRSLTAAVALAALGTLIPTTSASAAAPFVIDSDPVRVSVPRVGQTWGTATDTLVGRHVTSRYTGSVQRESAGPGCVFARVVYAYADGTTQAVESPRACVESVRRRDFSLTSSRSKDVVRYVVQLRASADSTGPARTLASATHLVGDAPDSLGTAVRLDHDVANVVVRGRGVVHAVSDYSLAKLTVGPLTVWNTRNRVVGDLTWSDELEGSYAHVQVTWTYSDGSTGNARSSRLYRGRGPVHFDLSSDRYKDAVSVKVRVATDRVVAAAAPDTKFGDHGRA